MDSPILFLHSSSSSLHSSSSSLQQVAPSVSHSHNQHMQSSLLSSSPASTILTAVPCPSSFTADSISLIQHLLTFNLSPKDIADILSTAPPLSASLFKPAATTAITGDAPHSSPSPQLSTSPNLLFSSSTSLPIASSLIPNPNFLSTATSFIPNQNNDCDSGGGVVVEDEFSELHHGNEMAHSWRWI
ncbi:hypothetical protein BUALT_Bualt06G0100800 [Buddleja alternifolia]|uniref:Uncharacterized protein n=1 Tax=Buddleja alternifolia TaxID=168488 RepID=A0AAV6XIE7_9LAMI|nr:hypothetical protein BUALT_Bualt06G0100800 [Buddleja alternifolia]